MTPEVEDAKSDLAPARRGTALSRRKRSDTNNEGPKQVSPETKDEDSGGVIDLEGSVEPGSAKPNAGTLEPSLAGDRAGVEDPEQVLSEVGGDRSGLAVEKMGVDGPR